MYVPSKILSTTASASSPYGGTTLLSSPASSTPSPNLQSSSFSNLFLDRTLGETMTAGQCVILDVYNDSKNVYKVNAELFSNFTTGYDLAASLGWSATVPHSVVAQSNAIHVYGGAATTGGASFSVASGSLVYTGAAPQINGATSYGIDLIAPIDSVGKVIAVSLNSSNNFVVALSNTGTVGPWTTTTTITGPFTGSSGACLIPCYDRVILVASLSGTNLAFYSISANLTVTHLSTASSSTTFSITNMSYYDPVRLLYGFLVTTSSGNWNLITDSITPGIPTQVTSYALGTSTLTSLAFNGDTVLVTTTDSVYHSTALLSSASGALCYVTLLYTLSGAPAALPKIYYDHSLGNFHSMTSTAPTYNILSNNYPYPGTIEASGPPIGGIAGAGTYQLSSPLNIRSPNVHGILSVSATSLYLGAVQFPTSFSSVFGVLVESGDVNLSRQIALPGATIPLTGIGPVSVGQIGYIQPDGKIGLTVTAYPYGHFTDPDKFLIERMF